MKKLERQRAQEEQAKRQEDEEAAAEKEDRGRPYTLSVALPGSILDNAQSPELRTYLAGQIARACAIFCVDEIVVFDEEGQDAKTVEGEFTGVGKKGQACVQLARILQYLECPQYLRKAFFPKHQDLQFAGNTVWTRPPFPLDCATDTERPPSPTLPCPGGKAGSGEQDLCLMPRRRSVAEPGLCSRVPTAPCVP